PARWRAGAGRDDRDPPPPARADRAHPGATVQRPERAPAVPTGRAGAQARAARAAELGIEVVVASPLRRTRETAEIVAATLGLPVEFDRDLVELDFGDIEGMTF